MSFEIFPTDNFANLRKNGGYYVDKTRFLEQFLKGFPEATLFTRPRRFGKSLFMSMLAEFFDIKKQGNGQNLFEGLAVSSNEKLCQEWMHQYPVISITLKGIDSSTFDDALKRIELFVSHICDNNIELLNSSAISQEDKSLLKMLCSMKANKAILSNALFILTRAMYRHYGKQVILLIDEYDVPVAKAAEKGYYDQMIDFMRDFLADALKTNPYLNFSILTGALRITKESMFTGLNNMECYDISSSLYSDIFGFTQDEVDKMLAKAGCEEKRNIIREWYDGYHFGKRQDIYCPWSIMQYLRELLGDQDDNPDHAPSDEPKAYWVNTSGNELTKGFVGHVPANIQDDMATLLAGNSIDVLINETLNYSQLYNNISNFWTLLYLTGYLTTTGNNWKANYSSQYKQRSLTIPNKEVRQVFNDEIVSWFNNIFSTDIIKDDFFKKFWEPDARGLEKIINETILTNSCFLDYQYGEHFYHALLLGIFINKYSIDSNRAAGTGIPDLTIHDKGSGSGAVIEVKRAQSKGDLDKCVQAALEQIVDHTYDERLKAHGCHPILHWGMAFFKKSCRVAVRVATSA